MIDYALETRNLTKHMGGRRIVRSVSLQIPKGSVYGLLGPNGAGKSTTLKLLTGLMCPSEGEVRIFGKPWSRDCLGRIGALIETPALYGNLTAYENLLVHSRLRGLPQGEIDKVLVITGLEATGKQLVSQFSLGMKQRLGLAIALLGDPEILILDEPTNGLDPIGIEEFQRTDPIPPFQRKNHPPIQPHPVGGGPTGRPHRHHQRRGVEIAGAHRAKRRSGGAVPPNRKGENPCLTFWPRSI